MSLVYTEGTCQEYSGAYHFVDPFWTKCHVPLWKNSRSLSASFLIESGRFFGLYQNFTVFVSSIRPTAIRLTAFVDQPTLRTKLFLR
jgi:hypothetical protein